MRWLFSEALYVCEACCLVAKYQLRRLIGRCPVSRSWRFTGYQRGGAKHVSIPSVDDDDVWSASVPAEFDMADNFESEFYSDKALAADMSAIAAESGLQHEAALGTPMQAAAAAPSPRSHAPLIDTETRLSNESEPSPRDVKPVRLSMPKLTMDE